MIKSENSVRDVGEVRDDSVVERVFELVDDVAVNAVADHVNSEQQRQPFRPLVTRNVLHTAHQTTAFLIT